MKYFFYLCLFSILAGPLAGVTLTFPDVSLYFTDISVILLCLFWIGKAKEYILVIKKDEISRFFLIFCSVLLLSFIFSPLPLDIRERMISGLYLLRYLSYFVIYITYIFLKKSKELTSAKVFTALGFLSVLLVLSGWTQYFFYPDLRNLYYLGWDPHFKRIFGSFLDPNFFGLILVLSGIVLFFFPSNNLPGLSILWLSRILVFLTLMFTYSRSSFLAFALSGLFYCLKKRKYLFFGAVSTVLFFSMLFLPRPGGEGVKLERIFSIEQRIENWKSGLELIARYPLLGTGFNTVRYAKIQYGFSPRESMLRSHSGAGFENSYIFIGVASGITGLFFFVLFLAKLYKNVGIMGKVSFVAVIVHSFFLNSFFFPPVMLMLWLIAAIDRKQNQALKKSG